MKNIQMKGLFAFPSFRLFPAFFLLPLILVSAPILGHCEELPGNSQISIAPVAISSPQSLQQTNQQTQQEQINNTYQKHRLDFETRKKEIGGEVSGELNKLQQEIRTVNREIADGEQQLKSSSQPANPEIPAELANTVRNLDNTISEYNSLLDMCKAINTAGVSILPITVLNVFLYLFFRRVTVFVRHKKALIGILIIVFLATATSLFAEPLDKRLEVESKLQYAEEMLMLTGNKKAISILENKQSQQIVLPDGLSSGDSGLMIYKTVAANSPEYYCTLAALYTAEKKLSKAVEAITAIAEKKGLIGNPSEQIIIASIHFLIENNSASIASKAVANHVGVINDTKALLDLADYLKAKAMQVSSDLVMDFVQTKTTSSSGLVVLADYSFKTGKTDKAIAYLSQALNNARDIADILLVAETSSRLEAESVFSKIPIKAKTLKGEVEQFIALAKIFNERGESIQVANSLQQSLLVLTKFEKLQLVVQAIIDFKQGPVMANLRERAVLLSSDLQRNANDKLFIQAYSQISGLVDFLITVNRTEDAISLFDDLVKKIKEERRKDHQYAALMLDCTRDALRRNFKKQAADIVLELTFTNPREKAYSTYIELHEDFLKSLQDIPDRSLISLPLYNGLINEDIDRLSDAEKAYMQAVLFSLESINNSLGEYLPDTLNHFFLLGRLWQKENRTNGLTSLDRVYTLLEKKMLKDLKEKERQRILTKPNTHLAELKEKRRQQLSLLAERNTQLEKQKAELAIKQQELIKATEVKIEEKKRNLSVLSRKALLNALASLVFLVTMLGLLVGCSRLAWQYSQRLKEHKTYGFFTKFTECIGWLGVFSIVGLIPGFLLIFSSQLSQILQKMHEIIAGQVPRLSYADPDVFPTEKNPELHIKTVTDCRT